MTITEARNILGPEIENLTDGEVEQLIQRERYMMKAFIEVFEKSLTTNLKGEHNG